jgi:hypothetical protein
MRCVSLTLAFVLAAASAARAQSAGSLVPEARTGDRLTITTSSGDRVRGRLLREASSALTIRADGRDATLPYTDIVRVDRYRNRVLLGPLIGLGGGLAAGLPLRTRFNNEGGNGDGWLALMVGLGVGFGTVADLFNGSTETVYSRGAGTSARFAVLPVRGGIGIEVTWGRLTVSSARPLSRHHGRPLERLR